MYITNNKRTNRSPMLRYFYFILIILFASSCSKKSAIVDSKKSMAAEKIEVQQAIPGAIPIDERVKMGTLANGLTYYIQKNAKPENRAELRLAVNAGSILEDDDQLGIAHFVEHMAFNGTTNFRKQELVDYLEGVGTRFGPDLNAYTSFDETVYMLQVRTDSTELLDKGIMILKDWASGISFEQIEIDKERGVVVSEWRTRLSPDQRMQQEILPVIYSGSQYAERLPIGDPEIIKNADYTTIKRFYQDWYRPDLMAVVVVGDIEPADIENQIKFLFSSIPPKANPRERSAFNVPSHDSTKIVISTDKEASFTNVRIINKLPKVKTVSLDDYKNSMMRSVYNGMLNVRLEEIGKEADPPFIFSYTGYSGDVGDIDSYSSFAMVPEGKAEIALERLMLENKRVLQHGFTAGELERQKKRMMESIEKQYKEMDKTESARLAMRYVYNFLDQNPIPGPDHILDLYKKFLPTITLKDINALPEQWISNDNRVVVVTGPENRNKSLTTKQSINSIIQKVDTLATTPYVDDVVEGPLLDADLSPVDITFEETDTITGITTMELANGVTVFLKPTNFKNDEIVMSATSEGGSSLYSDEDYFNADIASSVVTESGIGQFSSTQLDKLFAGKSVSVRPYISSYSEGLSGYASPKDVEDMFRLIYLYFTDVREDQQAFDSYIQKQIGIYENLLKNPNYYFSNYVSVLKFRNHPRVGFPGSREWSSVDLNKAMTFYRDRFSDASDFAMTFVGNFEVEDMKALAQKYLGNLPSIGREETYKDLNINPIPGTLKKRIKRGIAPKTQVHMYYSGEFDYTPENVYHLRSAIDYLRIKLREELREDKGGVYGVGISGGGRNIPDEKYSITLSFNADPDKADELVEAAKNVIIKAKREGPDEKDMQKVLETQRQTRIKNMEENNYWLRSIQSLYQDGRDFKNILLPAFEEKANNLTSNDIKMAVRKYFDRNYIEIIMDPREEKNN